MKQKTEKWNAVVEEMLESQPRLEVVQMHLRDLGLQPADNLLACMEQVFNRLEPKTKEKLLLKRSTLNEL